MIKCDVEINNCAHLFLLCHIIFIINLKPYYSGFYFYRYFAVLCFLFLFDQFYELELLVSYYSSKLTIFLLSCNLSIFRLFDKLPYFVSLVRRKGLMLLCSAIEGLIVVRNPFPLLGN